MNLLAIQQMPRRLYQRAAGHVFGDAMCGYDRAARHERRPPPRRHRQWRRHVTAASGTTQALINAERCPLAPEVYKTRDR